MTSERISETLDQLIPKENSSLYEAARYSLDGGKRLRPLLLLAVLETFDVPITNGLYPAASLEMIHTYSLIHDDLPCMDNDELRRGRPTLHVAYKENFALLVGDFLLTKAFETLSDAPHLSSNVRIQLISNLSSRAGSKGMIGGQLLDIENSDDWKKMHEMKTGALITSALECGGIISNQPLDLLSQLGSLVGLTYQLVDDLIDQDGAVSRFGVSKVEEMIDEQERKIQSLLAKFPSKAAPIAAIIAKMIHRLV